MASKTEERLNRLERWITRMGGEGALRQAEHDERQARLEQDRRRQAEAEKAERRTRLPDNYAEEAELYERFDALMAEMLDLFADMRQIHTTILYNGGGARDQVSDRFQREVKREVERRRGLARARAKLESDRGEAHKRNRIAHLRRVLEEQKATARQVIASGRHPESIEKRINETERMIAELEPGLRERAGEMVISARQALGGN